MGPPSRPRGPAQTRGRHAGTGARDLGTARPIGGHHCRPQSETERATGHGGVRRRAVGRRGTGAAGDRGPAGAMGAAGQASVHRARGHAHNVFVGER